jgi:penicillin amidase
MDVLRRRGGGELSEIFGSATLPLDREARMHGFLRLAHEVLEREPAGHRAIIQAYTEGVNAGLAALHAKPWEYSVLRIEPKPWTPEDIVLVNFAMTLDLQEGTGHYVRVLATIRDEMGPASLAFFAPLYTTGDAALDGSTGPVPPLPPASEVDLRTGDTPAPTTSLGNASWPDNETPGSNNMAVAGSLAAGGGALVANDMHLHLSVPNIWYRLSLKWPGHEETGVTLPGVPVIVAGSTGKLAWGFTNSDAGTGDIIVVDPSISPEMYHGPHGGDLVAYERRTETVPVRGSKAATMEFKWTVWGPVVAEGANGHQLVYHWSADDPAATNLAIIDLEDASGVRSAIAVAHRMGIAAQNFVVADSEGQIAWTVAGQIPRRVGYDGRLPVTWLYGDRRWDGYLGDEAPSIISPANGFLWTANNRTVGGKALAELGDAGYDIPARARQIRDDLSALVGAGRPVEPRDLLSIELDDRGMMLAPWHDLMVEALKPDAGPANPGRSALLEAAQKWDGRADTSSVGYRVVRDFRLAVAHRVLDPIFAACVERDPRLHVDKAQL